MSNIDLIFQKLKNKYGKVEAYFDKKNDMYVFLWYGFVIGKYKRDLFDKLNRNFIIYQMERFIKRIKILYSSNARETKNLK